MLSSLYLASCKKDSNPDENQEATLKSDKDQIELNSAIGSKDSFAVQFNGNWILSVNPSTSSWMKTNIVNGTGDSKVYVTAEERNNSASVRTATIVISSQNNPANSVTISVTQEKEKQWQELTAFPGIGRSAASAFVIDDKMYVGLGWGHKDNADKDLADFYEYNSSTNIWTKKADFPPGPREYAKGFALMGKGYIAMGLDSTGGNSFKDIWEYDALNDSWTKVATFNSLDNNAAGWAQVFVIDNKAYFYYQQKLWVFDPTNYSLSVKAPFPAPNDWMTFFAINGRGYAVAGQTGSGTLPTYLKSVYEYDPSTDQWSRKGDFPGHERAGGFGFSANGKGYMATGGYSILQGSYYEHVPLKEVWQYDAASDNWSQVADFPEVVAWPVVAVIGNKAIVGTGYPNPRTTVELGKKFWTY
jgi:N-acetylneuraminic acid mutarotase